MEPEVVITASTQLISLIEKLFDYFSEKKRKKAEKEDALKRIVYAQRCLPTVCKGDYHSEAIADYERKIAAFLDTFFPGKISTNFSKGTIEIFWSLRYGSQITSDMIERSLEAFIETCNAQGYCIN